MFVGMYQKKTCRDMRTHGLINLDISECTFLILFLRERLVWKLCTLVHEAPTKLQSPSSGSFTPNSKVSSSRQNLDKMSVLRASIPSTLHRGPGQIRRCCDLWLRCCNYIWSTVPSIICYVSLKPWTSTLVNVINYSHLKIISWLFKLFMILIQ